VFLDFSTGSAEDLGELLKKVPGSDMTLKFISNRGVKVWPDGNPETYCTDHWRCRFMGSKDDVAINNSQVIDLLSRINDAGFDFIKTENLYNFDGEAGYSKSH